MGVHLWAPQGGSAKPRSNPSNGFLPESHHHRRYGIRCAGRYAQYRRLFDRYLYREFAIGRIAARHGDSARWGRRTSRGRPTVQRLRDIGRRQLGRGQKHLGRRGAEVRLHRRHPVHRRQRRRRKPTRGRWPAHHSRCQRQRWHRRDGGRLRHFGQGRSGRAYSGQRRTRCFKPRHPFGNFLATRFRLISGRQWLPWPRRRRRRWHCKNRQW